MEKAAPHNIKPKSKIPVFKGKTTKTTKVTFKDECKGHMTERPCQSKIKNLCSVDNNSDIPFEPDVKALKSILNNKGIETDVSVNTRAMSERITSAVTPVALNRLTMWESQRKLKQSSYTPLKLGSDNTSKFGISENSVVTPKPSSTTTMMESYLEHQANIKIFWEKMQQHKDANIFVADSEAKNSILNGQGISAEFLARPSVYKQYSSSLSMMESYLEHEENVRKLRQTTQGILNGLTTPNKSSQEMNLTKSPFTRTASVKRNLNLSSSVRKVPLTTPKTNSFCTEGILNMQDVDHLPLAQKAISTTGCYSVGTNFSDVISGYRPTSILKNPLSKAGDMSNSLPQKHASINLLNNEQIYKDKENVPRKAHFVLNLSDKMRSTDMSGKDSTSISESSSLPEKSLAPANCLSLSNDLPKHLLSKCSQNSEKKLPIRVPVTPKEIEKVKPPSRTPFTPNASVKLPVRTPVTPRNNESQILPKRTPVMKSGNRKLYPIRLQTASQTTAE